jgi:enoyl-CoA hydratase
VNLDEATTITYEVVNPGEEGIARITLNRPEARNAQNKRMTYELNAAFDAAARSGKVKVIVLDANGPHFCAGHDLRDTEPMTGFDLVGPYGSFGREGQEGHMAWEEEVYFGMCWRWRNIPKPTIAAAQGKTIAGGLPLLWAMDLIVAADDALFSDPTVGMGVNGVEYFSHPFEWGSRKAKELLFTGDWITASEAHQRGMVNQVVPATDLHDRVMAMAARIAQRPSFALKLAKESVNQAEDASGKWNALRAAFLAQHLAHAHNRAKYGVPVEPARQPAPN